MAEAKPWEKYGGNDGPWSKYSTTTENTDTVDLEKSQWRKTTDHLNAIATEGIPAIADVGFTMATGAAGEIAGGLAGVVTLLYGGTLDQAVEAKDDVAGKLTLGPYSDLGKETIESLAPMMLRLENSVDEFAERKAMGNPLVATAIKTALLGGMEILPAAKGAGKQFSTRSNLRKQEARVRKIAADNGIKLKLIDFGDDLVEAVTKMSPDERAQNMPLVKEAIQRAAAAETRTKDALYKQARESQTFIETRAVRGLSDDIRTYLVEEGFDLDAENMRSVVKSLDDMKGAQLGFEAGQNLAVNLNKLEFVRRRINKRWSADGQTNTALGAVKKGIDNFLDDQFDNAAIEAGRIKSGSSLSGDAAGVKAWQDARAANKRWHENFSEDKVIANLINKKATSETYYEWIMGAGKMKAKNEAASTLRRMKSVLGDDHPAIKGIRQDFVFELVEPLLKTSEAPDFRGFVRRYDSIMRNSPSLVDELNISRTTLKDMRDFALVKRDLPPSGRIIDFPMLIRSIARLGVGHEISKAGVRVEFTAKLMNAFFGVDVVTPKQIIRDIAGIKYGDPAIPPNSIVASEFLAGAALTGIQEE